MLEAPAATAVTRPELLTVAETGWLLFHVRAGAGLLTGLPLMSVTTALSCCVVAAAAGEGLKTWVVLPFAPVIVMLPTAHSWKIAPTLVTGLVPFTVAVTVVDPGKEAKTLFTEPV